MTNLDNIVKNILEDAKIEADRIVEDAEKKALQAREDKIASIEADNEKAMKGRESLEARIRDRVRSGAERDIRNRILEAKQATIKRVFDLAKNELASMSDEEYKKLLDNFLDKKDLSDECRLEIPKNRSYKSNKVKIEKNADLKSGFRLVDGGIRENFDFSDIVDLLRTNMETVVLDLIKER